MAKRRKTYQAIIDEVSRGGERSSLFHFLVEQHDEIIGQAAGQRLKWAALCLRFAEHGLTDVRGLQATPETARKTWLRVRHVVAEARRRLSAAEAMRKPGDVYPSRISKDWRPQIVAAMPQAGVASSTPTSSARSVAATGSQARTPMDAPYEFTTVDDKGNQLEEGKVFYDGRVRTRQGAEQSERMRRRMEHEDRYR